MQSRAGDQENLLNINRQQTSNFLEDQQVILLLFLTNGDRLKWIYTICVNLMFENKWYESLQR